MERICKLLCNGGALNICNMFSANQKLVSNADSPCEHSVFITDDCNSCLLVLVTARNTSEIMQGKIFVGLCEHLFFYIFAAKTF